MGTGTRNTRECLIGWWGAGVRGLLWKGELTHCSWVVAAYLQAAEGGRGLGQGPWWRVWERSNRGSRHIYCALIRIPTFDMRSKFVFYSVWPTRCVP